MTEMLRVIVADDERPARSLLVALLRGFDGIQVVGEAATGTEAVEEIESKKPDLALLDLAMPEIDGLGVVRRLRKSRMPLVAFVTAYDEYAVRAFEMNAVDYVLKPVEAARLRETIDRTRQRLERQDYREEQIARIEKAASSYASDDDPPRLERIPVRSRDSILLVPVGDIVSVTAEGELLHIRTLDGKTHTICYRLRDLERRLEPGRFVRLGRGTLVVIDQIARVIPMPGATCTVVLKNDQEFRASRIQSRLLRDRLLRL